MVSSARGFAPRHQILETASVFTREPRGFRFQFFQLEGPEIQPPTSHKAAPKESSARDLLICH
jgi:hypothetical protein